MGRPSLHPSLHLAWAIANVEAHLAGARRIEPLHLLLAGLMIADDAWPQDASIVGPLEAARAAAAGLAAPAHLVLGMSGEDLTAARRALTLHLHGTEPRPMVNHAVLLHRSEAARDMFSGAVRRAVAQGSTEVTFLHLLGALVDNLPAVSAPQFAHRAPTKEKPHDRFSRGEARAPSHEVVPLLDRIGRDLSALARAGRLPAVVGRRAEMTAAARFLQRTTKPNVLIIGEAGVGKTAIVEGLAQRLAAPDAPEFLGRLRIIQVSTTDLVAGTRYRGELESRVQRLLAEAASEPGVVLFFDEIHLVMGGGAVGPGQLDIGNMLKPVLARGEVRCIGATTTEEYERHLKPDAAFSRRFQVVRVVEPSREESLSVCRAWAERIGRLQQVVFEAGAVEAAVELSARLIRSRALPDAAVDLLENAAARSKVSSLSFSSRASSAGRPRVGRDTIAAVLEEQWGLTVQEGDVLDANRVRHVLRSEIVGQQGAIRAVGDAIAGLAMRPADQRGVLGVLLFAGPTGVGKTLAAECLCRALFGTAEDRLGRFNMNEYKERHDLARLIGAPPGFVGHEIRGSLYRYAADQPEGLILLDEAEKAHPEIQDFFLQVFDKGVARDAQGRVVHFTRHLFVLTCNNQGDSGPGPRVGFQRPPAATKTGSAASSVAGLFRREFLARIERVIPFANLRPDDLERLGERWVLEIAKRIRASHGVQVTASRGLIKALADEAIAAGEGARGLRKLVDALVAAPLLQDLSRRGHLEHVEIGWDDGAASFEFRGNA